MRRRTVLALLALTAAGACAVARPRREPIEASLVGLQPVEVGLLEQVLEARLRLVNPNRGELAVDGLRVRLFLNGAALGRGVSGAPFVLPGLGEVVVPVRIGVQTADLVGRLAALGRSEGRFAYRLDGHLLVGGALGTVPFRRDGEIDLRAAAVG